MKNYERIAKLANEYTAREFSVLTINYFLSRYKDNNQLREALEEYIKNEKDSLLDLDDRLKESIK